MNLVGCSYYPDIRDLSYYGKYETMNQDITKLIKTDGFYYNSSIEEKDILMLYENGVYFSTFLSPRYSIWVDHEFPVCELPNKAKHSMSGWGVYIIEKDTIKMQSFVAYSVGMFRNYEGEAWAVIENDTTLRYIKWTTYDPKILHQNFNYRLRFKQCASKSDSMNIFFKMNDE